VRSIAVVFLLAAACGRPAGPVEYGSPRLGFTAAAPASWKADESQAAPRRAALYGPPAGSRPFAESIIVSFHPAGGRWAGPAAYLAAAALVPGAPPSPPPDPAARETVFERATPSMHGKSLIERVRLVAVETPGGFFVLEHAYPATGYEPGPEFEAFRSSFKPLPR
jgi:hypothetical protein